jgi:hypothetical protein
MYQRAASGSSMNEKPHTTSTRSSGYWVMVKDSSSLSHTRRTPASSRMVNRGPGRLLLWYQPRGKVTWRALVGTSNLLATGVSGHS